MDKSYRERVCTLALNRIFGSKPQISYNLIRTLGSASAVFDLDRQEIRRLFGASSAYARSICAETLDSADSELSRLGNIGVKFIGIGDRCYPDGLRECPDAPIGLYVKSLDVPENIFNRRPLISIVGTRDMSPYGKQICTKVVGGLSRTIEKPAVVSGLAIGVDITAHLAALGYSLPTVAVLPTGITDVYPRMHEVAAEKISSAPGSAVITDFPLGTLPQKYTFLRRNRIIAGLSGATLLIESGERGGGMITAKLASDYGRQVFAVPGRVDDIRSAGCNRLLHMKIAEPLVTVDGFSDDLGLTQMEKICGESLEKCVRERYAGRTDASGLLNVALLVKAEKRMAVEDIARKLGLGYEDALSLCGILESDGILETDLLQYCSINPKID